MLPLLERGWLAGGEQDVVMDTRRNITVFLATRHLVPDVYTQLIFQGKTSAVEPANPYPPHRTRSQDADNLQFSDGWACETHDPRHALQKNGGWRNTWFMDGGDIVCHPVLVPFYLHEFDHANNEVGAERNPQKTEVIYYVEDLNAAPAEWKLDDVRKLATVSTVTAGSTALGVAVGPRQFIADQLSAKADDIRAMHERVQLCQFLQTESALLRESLGVSRINHSLRVHGHKILQEKRAAAIYDEIGQRSLEKLFPGFTEDTLEQATSSAGQSGIGYRRARDIAAPAHLVALIAARPRIRR